MIFDRLFKEVAQKRNPSVVGLDTQLDYLPESMLEGFDPTSPFESAGQLLLQFNKGLIDALADIVPCVKLQIAFYEMYGHHGIRAYTESVEYARQKGLVVIADAKRNDIGSTAAAYAKTFLGQTAFPDGVSRPAVNADILTVTAYLGEDGIMPFVEECKNGKGIFVLVKTSNPSSGQLQDQMIGNKTVYEVMAGLVQQWGKDCVGSNGYSSVGAVVGATWPEQGSGLRAQFEGIPFLLPGYGAQGATGADLALCFDKDGLGSVVNASRSIICAHKKQPDVPYDEAARMAATAMKEDLLSSLQKAGRLNY